MRARLGPNYWKLLSGSSLANLGDGLMAVAVVWLATALTRDASLIALVGLASRLPWLVFSLPAGVITDRFDRRRLVAAMDALRCLVVAAFAVLLLAHQSGLPTPEALAAGAPTPSGAGLLLTGLVVMSLALGFAEVVRDNTAQTLLPSVVEDSVLARANSRLWGAEMTMNQFIGPPLAGVLIAVAIALPFFANAGLLAVSAVLVFALAGNFRAKGSPVAGPGEQRTRINWRAEIGEGFGWLWRHPVLRPLAFALGVMNMASSVAAVVFVLFAQEVLGLFSGWQYGVLLMGGAVGAVLGSAVADRIAQRLRDSRALLLSIVVLGVAWLVTAATSSAVVVWVAQLLSGVFIVVWNVITVTLRQRIIPDHLLGRVNSVYRFFGWGSLSLGMLLGGLLVTWAEPMTGREWALRTPFIVAGATYLVLLVFAARRFTEDRLARATEAS